MAKRSAVKNGWISVKDRLPEYSQDIQRGRDTPVLVWPSCYRGSGSWNDGFAYFGPRCGGKPQFYFLGVILVGVKFWQYLPNGPK